MSENIAPEPLLPFPRFCITGTFLQRQKRFSVALRCGTEEIWIHSNNTGSMRGLLRPGATTILASPAANPARKLKYTMEAVSLPNGAGWVGVNTLTPNRMLETAFHAGRLPFAAKYTALKREAPRGQSRLDGCFTAPGLPPLWVECKNVTLVEEDIILFPDAVTERGQKHLRELREIVRGGERAAMFYLVQRPDGQHFASAATIDPAYAALFDEVRRAGVEIYPYRAVVSERGIDLTGAIPLL